MLLTYRLKDNKGCATIADALCDIDARLVDYTTDLYNEKVFMAKMPINDRAIKDLLYYKHILTHLAMNPQYFSTINYQQVVSKVKTLI